MKRNLKVAIIQDYMRYGGRFMVIASMIETCNQLHIKPDLLSFFSDINREGIKDKYHSDLEFNSVNVPFNFFKKMTEFRKIWFNLIIALKYARKYDIIINSNNSAIFLPSKGVVNYCHFPRYDRIIKNEFFQTHQKIALKTKLLVQADYKLSGLLYRLFSSNKRHINLANSKFTKNRLSSVHGISLSSIEVLYPPVVNQINSKYEPFKKKKIIISIGRFSQTKNQLLQLQMAKENPDIHFKLIGFSKDGNDYLTSCNNFIKREQIINAELLVNISYQDLQKELEQASFFLHTTFEEPFGITPVQAIANNCIPIVPDSGGPVEIVPIDRLRFETKDEAISVIKNMGEIDDHSSLLSELRDNLKRFSKEEFIQKFNKILQAQNLTQ